MREKKKLISQLVSETILSLRTYLINAKVKELQYETQNNSENNKEIFSETIDSFSYSECPGHPIWIEPDEWLGSKLTKKFPYHLVSPQPIDKLHSQLECAISDIPNERFP